MILECPNCETNYELPVELPPEGRKVRCAKCRHIWTARPVAEQPSGVDLPNFEDEEIVFQERAPEETQPSGNGEPASSNSTAEPAAESAEDTDADEPSRETPGDDARQARTGEAEKDNAAEAEKAVAKAAGDDRDDKADEESDAEETETLASLEEDTQAQQAEPEEQDVQAGEAVPDQDETQNGEATLGEEEAAPAEEEAGDEGDEVEEVPIVIGKAQRRIPVPTGLAAGWSILVLFMVGLAGFVYFQRIEVVRALPGTAWLYEQAGLPVNVRGLAFENVEYSWEVDGDQAMLEVRGEIVNITGRSRKVPTVVLGLRTEDNVEVYQWAQEVRSEPLAAGARTQFAARIPTPPKSIRDVQLRFAKVR